MDRRCFLYLLALAGATAVPAYAQQPTRSALAGDARLDQPISVSWKKATLYDALLEVSKKTGVKLTPEMAVVDEPIMVSATGVPARQVLDHVATLLDFTWSRSTTKSGQSTYLLFQSRAARERELAELQGAERAVLEALNRDLARYRAAAKLPPEQLERQLQKADQEMASALMGGFGAAASDPRFMRRFQDAQALRSAGTPIGRAMLGMLDSLSPDQWIALRNERPLVFSTHPQAGELPLGAGFQDQLRAGTPAFPFPKQLFSSFGPQVVTGIEQVEKMAQDRWSKASGYKVTVNLALNVGAQPVGMLRVVPTPVMAEAGPDGLDVLSSLTGLNITGSPQLEEEMEDPAEREKRLSADPVLGKKARLQLPKAEPSPGFLAILGSGVRAAEILPAVEKAFGVRLISDAYNRQAMTFVQPFGDVEVPLYRVLDAVAGGGRRWERDGDTIRIKSKTWAHDRRGEIPVRYMRRWLEVRDRKGGFALEDLAEISALLRDEQVDSLMFSALEADAKDMTDFVMISTNRSILRLYGRLIPPQRQALQRTGAIAIRDLFPYQQALLADLNRSQNRSMFGVAFGAKPQRTPAQLANGVLRFKRQDIPAPPAGAPNPAAGAGPAAAGFNLPSSIYTLEVDLGNNIKDQFTIPLTRVKPEPKPVSPPAEK